MPTKLARKYLRNLEMLCKERKREVALNEREIYLRGNRKKSAEQEAKAAVKQTREKLLREIDYEINDIILQRQSKRKRKAYK